MAKPLCARGSLSDQPRKQIRIDIAAGQYQDDVPALCVDIPGQQGGEADRTAGFNHQLQLAKYKADRDPDFGVGRGDAFGEEPAVDGKGGNCRTASIGCNINIILQWKMLVSRFPSSGACPPITYEAIRELASREDAGALNALAEAAAVEDQFLRRTTIEVIGRHPQGRELRAIILSALGDPSEYVVRTACEVVAQWEFSEAHELMVALLADDSEATRQAAIRALGTIWVDADFPLIFRIYTNASEIDLRREAAWVLRRRVSSMRWRTLFNAFYVDELPRHRKWACELAENFSGSEILPVLSQLSMDTDGHVRKAASQAIRTLSSRE